MPKYLMRVNVLAEAPDSGAARRIVEGGLLSAAGTGSHRIVNYAWYRLPGEADKAPIVEVPDGALKGLTTLKLAHLYEELLGKADASAPAARVQPELLDEVEMRLTKGWVIRPDIIRALVTALR